METGFLNFHDDEHFSDFSLSLEQNVVEKPQDLLMHMVENDFDYMEAHLDVANCTSLWNNKQRHNGDDEMSGSKAASKIDGIKEDFAKVLTDWQEHIGYLQASDMDEYMDIIGISMNVAEKRNFCTSETVLQEEHIMHTLDSDILITKQEDLEKESIHGMSAHKAIECAVENDSYYKINDFAKVDKQIMETKTKSLLIEPKYLKGQSNLKRNIHKYINTRSQVPTSPTKKQKKKKKEKSVKCNKSLQSTEYSNDISSAHQMPVLEARDVKSLLEQFEASESTYTSIGMNAEYDIDLPLKLNDKSVKDILPDEVIEKLKTSAHKKVISVIPAISSIQRSNRSNGTRMQEAAATLFRNKLLKIVTNNTKTKTIDGGLVQLDHDYCYNNSSISSTDSNSEYEKQFSDSEKVSSKKYNNMEISQCSTPCEKKLSLPYVTKGLKKIEVHSIDNNSKGSGLESGEISDNSEYQPRLITISDTAVSIPIKALKTEIKDNKMEDSIWNNTLKCVGKQNLSTCSNHLAHEHQIHSTKAKSILQLPQSVLSKMNLIKDGKQRTKQMVSVLKKPLNIQNMSTSIMTSTENLVTHQENNEIKDVTVQDSEKLDPSVEEKKPPRKKLNLAEYRSRREQNRSDNSRTNSPLQPMTLIYVYHASTCTEPINDGSTNLIWSEREIVSVLKPKVDVEENKVRPRPSTSDIGIQTYETVFEFPPRSTIVDVDERNSELQESDKQPCNGHRIRSNSSRPNSRNKSKSRSRSRSSSYGSKSRKRSDTRRRRIGHRRSSVSSSSSWSSHSRSRSRTRSNSRSRSRMCLRSRSCSDTRSTFSSKSGYSRSRSRSSRSRSPSSCRYSSCSRSSSDSNCGRNKWPRRRKEHRTYYRNYDRHRQQSVGNYHGYRDWRRSPTNSCRGSYDNWYDREKQKQVEERRVIYVGRLDEGITKADLRRRFEIFGPVIDISVHFREHGDNYGFVTFAYKNDAYKAVEHGNDDPTLPRYDLCFGGRRAFCKVKYADLDGMASNSLNSGRILEDSEDNTFDFLLKEAKAKLRKRKV